MRLSSSLDQKFPEDQSNDCFARSPQHPAWGLVYYLLLTKCHQVSKTGHIISTRERIEEELLKKKEQKRKGLKNSQCLFCRI